MMFVANLRDRTIEAFGRHGIQPDAYLLSTHRISPAALGHAHSLREDGVPIVADNGSKALIDQVISTFRVQAEGLRRRVREIRHAVGHTPRGRDVPQTLRREASHLAHEVVALATMLSEAVDAAALLEAQLSMHPTHVVAQEDFAVACLLALNLERETTAWPVRSFEARNRRSLRLWRGVMEDPRVSDLTVYAVLSAADYNTGRAAGRLASDAGVRNVAIGCAGFLLDPTSVDFYTIGNASYRLQRPCARRYARLALVISGIRDGFALAGGRLLSLHALGLGAPALFPLFAAAAPGDAELSTDATSPIHDAERDRVLYDPVRHGARLSMHRIVDSVLHGQDWTFTCPFCSRFRELHGHDPGRARAVWEAAGKPIPARELLNASPELALALPLFVDTDREARRTHVAHNHWVLGQLAREIPEGHERWDWAHRRMAELVDGSSLIVDRGLVAGVEILERIRATDRFSTEGDKAAAAKRSISRGAMEIKTSRSIADILGRAAEAGALRSRLAGAVERLMRDVDAQIQERENDIHGAWAVGPDRLYAALDDLVVAGDRFPTVHDAVVTALDIGRGTEAMEADTLQALTDLAGTAQVERTGELLSNDAADNNVAEHDAPPLHLRQHARTILRLFRKPLSAEILSKRLAHWSFLRLWGLHGLVLLSIVRARAQGLSGGVETIAAGRAKVEERVRDLRDRVQAALASVNRSGRATPATLLSLRTAVHRSETWIREQGAPMAGAVCGAATAAVAINAADADRQGRDAAILYDQIRTLLALLAGAHAAIRAYVLLDGRALSELAASSTLPVSPATLDLPRSSVAAAAGKPEGEVVETAALVLNTDIRAGGPAPRSVLTIGTRTGAQLRVLLPFLAADSFGVAEGVWVQVRGTIFPTGKEDLKGPVLQVRRIQRERASAESFFDALIWAGRHEFNLRPGQMDIVAGRRAGERLAAAELGIRR